MLEITVILDSWVFLSIDALFSCDESYYWIDMVLAKSDLMFEFTSYYCSLDFFSVEGFFSLEFCFSLDMLSRISYISFLKMEAFLSSFSFRFS